MIYLSLGIDENNIHAWHKRIIYIILAACLLPYVFTGIAKMAGGFKARDNQNPREFLAQTKGVAARANAAQQNSFESLPLLLRQC